MTPSEVELGRCRPDPIRYTEGGELEPRISIRREHVSGDLRLLYPVIKVKPKHRSAAQKRHPGKHHNLLAHRSSTTSTGHEQRLTTDIQVVMNVTETHQLI